MIFPKTFYINWIIAPTVSLMNANTTKIVAVVAIIVIVAAGVGGYFLLHKEKSNGPTINAALEVYGNANNDYKIDNSDVDIIKKVMNTEEGYTLEKYPLADANHDSKVDQSDVDLAEKIIAGGDVNNKIKVWVINHTTDTTTYPNGQYAAEVHWPVSKCVANGAANALIIYEMVGIRDNIVGINYSSSSPPDSIVYKHYNEMPSLGSSTMYLDETPLSKCVADNAGTTLVITADNKGYLDGTKGVSEAYIKDTMKLDVVRIEHAAVDPDKYSSALLTLGFLFQKNTKAQEAADWTTKVFKEVTDKVSSVSTKVRVAATSYYNYLSARNSDYADVVVQAGGEYVLSGASTSSVYFEDSGTHTKDPNILKKENQPDVIIALRTSAFLGKAADGASWYGSTDKWDTTTMNNQLKHFEVFDCYGEGKEKVYTVSGDCPIVARVLYSAALMYPDLVSMDYANEKHQEFVDKFLGGSYKVSECHFVLTQKDIRDLSAA